MSTFGITGVSLLCMLFQSTCMQHDITWTLGCFCLNCQFDTRKTTISKLFCLVHVYVWVIKAYNTKTWESSDVTWQHKTLTKNKIHNLSQSAAMNNIIIKILLYIILFSKLTSHLFPHSKLDIKNYILWIKN